MLFLSGTVLRQVPSQPLLYHESNGSVFVNRRRLDELPYHLAMAGDVDGYHQHCLRNFEWLYTKASFSSVQDLGDEIRFAVKQKLPLDPLVTSALLSIMAPNVRVDSVDSLLAQFLARFGQTADLLHLRLAAQLQAAANQIMYVKKNNVLSVFVS